VYGRADRVPNAPLRARSLSEYNTMASSTAMHEGICQLTQLGKVGKALLQVSYNVSPITVQPRKQTPHSSSHVGKKQTHQMIFSFLFSRRLQGIRNATTSAHSCTLRVPIFLPGKAGQSNRINLVMRGVSSAVTTSTPSTPAPS